MWGGKAQLRQQRWHQISSSIAVALAEEEEEEDGEKTHRGRLIKCPETAVFIAVLFGIAAASQ